MAIFITGSTGYLGSYVTERLLRCTNHALLLLIRGRNQEEAKRKLWASLQLHMGFEEFQGYLARMKIYLGDLTTHNLGIEGGIREELIDDTESVLHIAASLNRKSDKACLNHNLRGTLHVIRLAKEAHERHGLKRFSEVSTVAVAGVRKDEVVQENAMIDWERSDYDPYARTKKFGEYMVHQLLEGVPKTIFRPSIVLGDSRFPATTQFDMVQAFVHLSKWPVLPFHEEWRADIVPADFVGQAIVDLHLKEKTEFESYNLSSGIRSLSYRQIVEVLASTSGKKTPMFVPALEGPVSWVISHMANTPRSLGVSRFFSMMKVFWPYLNFNTVFDNTRVTSELGILPTPFDAYAPGLKEFAEKHRFKYPYRAWPDGR